MLPAVALLVPTVARGSRRRARARVRELGGGLAAEHLGAEEREREEHDDSRKPVHGRDRGANEDQQHHEHDDPECERGLLAHERRDRPARPDGQTRGQPRCAPPEFVRSSGDDHGACVTGTLKSCSGRVRGGSLNGSSIWGDALRWGGLQSEAA
jgi:hypothetical protein